MSIEAGSKDSYVQRTPPLAPRRSSAGRAALVLLAAVSIGAVWLVIRIGADGDPTPAPPAGPTPERAGDARLSAGPPPTRESAEPGRTGQTEEAGTLAAEGRLQVGGDFPWKAAAKDYDGLGTLSGAVETPPGVAFPDRWTLVIEPSLFGKGREHAGRRVRELDGAQRTFEERDLPLGGYRVSVEAEGMNARPQEVLLFRVADRPELAGKAHAHLVLSLAPAGHLDGSVRDERGVPLSGVDVSLRPIGEPKGGSAELRTESDYVGHWRIESVRDGRYELVFGHPDRPLIPPEEVVFVGPSQRIPERVLPPLVDLVIRVVDEAGGPLPAATIRGFVRPRGAIEETTDAFGLARVRNAIAGEYNVRVLHASGRQGKSVFRVEPDPPLREVEILCQPPR